MNQIKKMLLAILLVFLQMVAFGQDLAANPASNDLMRSNGKIFLVMTIVVVLMTGLLFYLISIDRKISKLEKK
jgi:preprotein translocase subunit SecY